MRLEFDEKIKEVLVVVENQKPVEIVKPPSPKGPKVTQEDIDRWNLQAKNCISLNAQFIKLDNLVTDEHHSDI